MSEEREPQPYDRLPKLLDDFLREPVVRSFDPATGISRGAWFGATHRCPDGQLAPLHWEHELAGAERNPRRWLVCDRCLYAVDLVVRHPKL